MSGKTDSKTLQLDSMRDRLTKEEWEVHEREHNVPAIPVLIKPKKTTDSPEEKGPQK